MWVQCEKGQEIRGIDDLKVDFWTCISCPVRCKTGDYLIADVLGEYVTTELKPRKVSWACPLYKHNTRRCNATKVFCKYTENCKVHGFTFFSKLLRSTKLKGGTIMYFVVKQGKKGGKPTPGEVAVAFDKKELSKLPIEEGSKVYKSDVKLTVSMEIIPSLQKEEKKSIVSNIVDEYKGAFVILIGEDKCATVGSLKAWFAKAKAGDVAYLVNDTMELRKTLLKSSINRANFKL